MVPSATPAASAMARVVARAYPTCPTTSVVAWMSLARVRAPRSLMAPPSPSVVRSGRASFGDIATHQGEGGRTEPDGGIGQSEADRRAVAERVGPTAGQGGEGGARELVGEVAGDEPDGALDDQDVADADRDRHGRAAGEQGYDQPDNAPDDERKEGVEPCARDHGDHIARGGRPTRRRQVGGPGDQRAQGDAHDGGDGRGDRGPAGQGEHLAGKQAQTVRLSLYEHCLLYTSD